MCTRTSHEDVDEDEHVDADGRRPRSLTLAGWHPTNAAMRDPRVLVPLCALLVGACSDSAELQEWRPEDHQAPPAVASEDRAAPPTEGAQVPPEQRIARALYAAQCQTCHGSDGRGGGPGLPPGAPAPDFTDASWQAEQQDTAMARSILEGRGMMPAFQGKLSGEEVSLLVEVVRGFGGEPEASAKAAEEPPQDTAAPEQGP